MRKCSAGACPPLGPGRGPGTIRRELHSSAFPPAVNVVRGLVPRRGRGGVWQSPPCQFAVPSHNSGFSYLGVPAPAGTSDCYESMSRTTIRDRLLRQPLIRHSRHPFVNPAPHSSFRLSPESSGAGRGECSAGACPPLGPGRGPGTIRRELHSSAFPPAVNVVRGLVPRWGRGGAWHNPSCQFAVPSHNSGFSYLGVPAPAGMSNWYESMSRTTIRDRLLRQPLIRHSRHPFVNPAPHSSFRLSPESSGAGRGECSAGACPPLGPGWGVAQPIVPIRRTKPQLRIFLPWSAGTSRHEQLVRKHVPDHDPGQTAPAASHSPFAASLRQSGPPFLIPAFAGIQRRWGEGNVALGLVPS